MDDTSFLQMLMMGLYGRIMAGVWGVLWGSFANVLIVRLPEGESVVAPASHCRGCQTPIAWYDNIPVLSFLLLRGRCRHCGKRISPRYVLVELLVCLLAVAMHQLLVVGGVGSLGTRLAQFVISSLFCGTLVAVTFIDLQTLRIPDAITYPAIPLAIVLSLFFPHPHLWDGLVGGLAGYGIIRIIADSYRLITGREGMGYGDAKLLALIGGLLGWQFLLPILFLAALQGTIIGISALMILRRRKDEITTTPQNPPPPSAEEANEPPSPAPSSSPSLRHVQIPFGPFLSLAAIEIFFLRDSLQIFFPYFW